MGACDESGFREVADQEEEGSQGWRQEEDDEDTERNGGGSVYRKERRSTRGSEKGSRQGKGGEKDEDAAYAYFDFGTTYLHSDIGVHASSSS